MKTDRITGTLHETDRITGTLHETDRITGTLHEDLYTFVTVSCSFRLRIRNVQIWVVKKMKGRIVYSIFIVVFSLISYR